MNKDHPRRCGENTRLWTDEQTRTGSPPQVRGKPNDETSISAHTGITPAGAGKTVGGKASAGRFPDHPRRCGENFVIFIYLPGFGGSPPQVRGKLSFFLCQPSTYGITPAGAGKTISCRLQLGSSGDHPRRCGENEFLWRVQPAARGSPPQVRGKQCIVIIHGAETRITPAGAGKTLKRSFRNQPFCS